MRKRRHSELRDGLSLRSFYGSVFDVPEETLSLFALDE